MATPTPNITVSYPASLLPPCKAFFDNAAVVDADAARPYRDVFQMWGFGDDDGTTFTAGSIAGHGRNYSYGPLAIHVYRTKGVKRWSNLCISPGGQAIITTGTVTIADPDTYFAGTNTVAVGASAGTLPVAGVTAGVPAGALCVVNSSWDSILDTYKGKRLLGVGGDTFMHSVQPSNVEVMVQRYGSCGSGRPKLRFDPAVTSQCLVFDNGASGDVAFSNWEIDGTTSVAQVFADINGHTDEFLLDQCYIHDVEDGFVCVKDDAAGWVAHDSIIGPIIGGSGRNSVFQTGTKMGLVGCDLPVTDIGEHNLRMMGVYKGVYSNNTLRGSSTNFGGKSTFAVRPNAMVLNGTFTTDLSDWTDADVGLATSVWAAGGYMSLTGTGVNAAIRKQTLIGVVGQQFRATVTVNSGTTAVLRIGSTDGGTDYVNDQALAVGLNTLATKVTLGTSIYVQLRNVSATPALIDRIDIGRVAQYIVGYANNVHTRDYAGMHIETNVSDVYLRSNKYSTDGGDSLRVNGEYVSSFNDAFNATNNTDGVIKVLDSALDPGIAQNIMIVNPSIYNGTSTTNLTLIAVGAGCVVGTNTVKNVVARVPNISGTATVLADASGAVVTGNNTSNANAKTVNPLFEGPLVTYKDFRIAAGSPYASGGASVFPTNFADGFGGDSIGGNAYCGALLPRTDVTYRQLQ